MRHLLDIHWSDLYLGETLESSCYAMTPDAHEMLDLPGHLADEIAALRQHLEERRRDLEERFGQGHFSIKWPQTPGAVAAERLRVKPYFTVDLNPMFVLGRAAGQPMTLIESGFPPAVVAELLEQRRRGGLILLLGRMGSGKTSAAYSFIRDYTLRHGGRCICVDNPIERVIEGRCGKGFIRQTEIGHEREAGAALRGTLRSRASLIKAPEIISDETAREVLHLARSGSLVVADTHGEDLITGLARVSRMTGGQHGDLADALIAVFHLRLGQSDSATSAIVSPEGPQGTPAPPNRQLLVTSLLITPENQKSVRSQISGGQFAQLTSEIERQKRMLLQVPVV